MAVIKKLLWDGWNINYVARHKVAPEEVEEACSSKHIFTKGRQGTYRIIGQTQNGRYLTIILSPRNLGNFYPVTARDVDSKEGRRLKSIWQ